jgi:hypothetical protein
VTLAERFGWQPSELWVLTGRDLIFWAEACRDHDRKAAER